MFRAGEEGADLDHVSGGAGSWGVIHLLMWSWGRPRQLPNLPLRLGHSLMFPRKSEQRLRGPKQNWKRLHSRGLGQFSRPACH